MDELYKPRPKEIDSLFWNSRYQDSWAPFWQKTYIKYLMLIIAKFHLINFDCRITHAFVC